MANANTDPIPTPAPTPTPAPPRRRRVRLNNWLDHSAIAARGLPHYLGKKTSINYISATLDILVLIILLGCLVEPKWILLRGGGCSREELGMGLFFMSGTITNVYHPKTDTGPSLKNKNSIDIIYSFGSNKKVTLTNCVTPEIVTTMRILLGLIFFGILCTLIQFGLDVLVFKRKIFRLLQINAIGNISTVLITSVCAVLCYWAAKLIEQLQEETKSKYGAKVVIQFGLGFYMIATASGISIMAIAANCLRPLSIQNPIDSTDSGENFQRSRLSAQSPLCQNCQQQHNSASLLETDANVGSSFVCDNCATGIRSLPIDENLISFNDREVIENQQTAILSTEELEQLLGPDPFSVLPASHRQPPAYSP